MRLRDIVISVAAHASLAALVLAWPVSEPPAQPRIYEVALAEAAPAPAGPPAQPAPQTAQPAPPKPTPQKTAPPPAERVISAKKAPEAQAPAPEEPPAPPAQAASGQTGAPAQGVAGGRAGPQMRSFGGVSAYDGDAVDERPSVLRGVVPEYPYQARRMRQEGRVLVRVVVDEQGSPVTALVQEAKPAGVFDQAALGAARRFRFLPGKIAGRRVVTAVLIPFEFTLR